MLLPMKKPLIRHIDLQVPTTFIWVINLTTNTMKHKPDGQHFDSEIPPNTAAAFFTNGHEAAEINLEDGVCIAPTSMGPGDAQVSKE